MGIRFICPSCDNKLNVKSYLGGKRGICPHCDARIRIPLESGMGEHTASYAGDKPRRPMSIEDCVSERPDLKWFVRPPSGGEFGPASGEVLTSWVSERRIDKHTELRRHDWIHWQPASVIFTEFNDAKQSSVQKANVSEDGATMQSVSNVAVLERPANEDSASTDNEPFADDDFFVGLESNTAAVDSDSSFINLQVEQSTLAHHNLRRSNGTSNKLKSVVLAMLSIVLLGSLVAVIVLSQ
tara:strand:+ start:131 stop:850 length:720 start_codon:yes stop_codon:yes gene_type:complete